MLRTFAVPGAFVLALLAVPVARAATDADLAEIRDQIRQLKESYEARIQALEQRLKEAESKSATAPQSAAASDTACRCRACGERRSAAVHRG
jgi:hypothetical protein